MLSDSNKIIISCQGKFEGNVCGYTGEAYFDLGPVHGQNTQPVIRCPRCGGINIKVTVVPQIRG